MPPKSAMCRVRGNFSWHSPCVPAAGRRHVTPSRSSSRVNVTRAGAHAGAGAGLGAGAGAGLGADANATPCDARVARPVFRSSLRSSDASNVTLRASSASTIAAVFLQSDSPQWWRVPGSISRPSLAIIPVIPKPAPR